MLADKAPPRNWKTRNLWPVRVRRGWRWERVTCRSKTGKKTEPMEEWEIDDMLPTRSRVKDRSVAEATEQVNKKAGERVKMRRWRYEVEQGRSVPCHCRIEPTERRTLGMCCLLVRRIEGRRRSPDKPFQNRGIDPAATVFPIAALAQPSTSGLWRLPLLAAARARLGRDTTLWIVRCREHHFKGVWRRDAESVHSKVSLPRFL
eukprot:ctg_415.g137